MGSSSSKPNAAESSSSSSSKIRRSRSRELRDGGVGGGRRNLKRLAFDDVRSARSDAEEVRVRNNAESFVVVENTALVVPFGIGRIDHGTKLWRESEGKFEYARILFW